MTINEKNKGPSNGVKIVVAAPLYPPEIGGPATHAVIIESELPARGFSLNVLPFSRVRKYPKLIRHISYAGALMRRARHADAIYALDPVSVGLPAYIASLLCRKPYVLRIGGDYAWEQGIQRFGVTETLDTYLKEGSPSLAVYLLAVVQSYVARRAHAVIAPSKYLASVAAAWGVDTERITIAYSAPELLPSITRAEARTAFGVGEGVFLVASAARLVPWKGYECLIDAMALLRLSVPSAMLIIAGDGPEREALEKRVQERGLSHAVRFLGSVPRERVGALIAASDCFALNTRYEGLSHQLMEAFMMGAPVVTTNAGGNAELVEDGVSGLIVSFNDADAWTKALARLAGDAALRTRLSAGGMTRLGDFSTPASIDAIAQALTCATQRI